MARILVRACSERKNQCDLQSGYLQPPSSTRNVLWPPTPSFPTRLYHKLLLFPVLTVLLLLCTFPLLSTSPLV